MDSAILTGFILAVILVVLVVAVVLILRDPPPTNVYLKCNPGECATSISTGAKRCAPNNTDSVIYNPLYEVCNRRALCDSSATLYAERSDGSTSIFGGCQKDLPCRCLKELRCANHYISTFQSAQGSVFSMIERPVLTIGVGSPPIVIEDSTTEFCSLTGQYLPNVVGANGCAAAANTPSATNFKNCLKSNPCPSGVMAFVPRDPDSFVFSNSNTEAWITEAIGCVAGDVLTSDETSDPLLIGTSSLCQGPNEVPLYDVTRNQLRCHTVS